MINNIYKYFNVSMYMLKFMHLCKYVSTLYVIQGEVFICINIRLLVLFAEF